MRGIKRSIAALGATALLAVGLVTGAGPAHAAHVACGQTIVANTVLDSNVGPCSAGITIGADNITLDLNGFAIRGVPTTGDGAGIHGVDRTGTTVKRGIVTEFDAGVMYEGGGGGNLIDQMQILHNRGSFATDFGDGIGFYFSNGNRATRNLVQNNGPYDGIGILGSDNNVVDQNKVIDNNQISNRTAGIALENAPGGFTDDNNTITRNLVQNSATWGIQLFAGGSFNQLRTNKVVGGNFGGIRLFAGNHHNILDGNIVQNTSGPFAGISVQAAAGNFGPANNNQLLNNTATKNAPLNLLDSNANCGTNQWHGNQGPPATPPCTLSP